MWVGMTDTTVESGYMLARFIFRMLRTIAISSGGRSLGGDMSFRNRIADASAKSSGFLVLIGTFKLVPQDVAAVRTSL